MESGGLGLESQVHSSWAVILSRPIFNMRLGSPASEHGCQDADIRSKEPNRAACGKH